MSGQELPVPSPHQRAVEQAAHSGDAFSNNIAVMTAILATIGAMSGYQGGATQNDASMYKNNAAIEKAKATNSWNYYQAKSNQQNLARLAMLLPGIDPAKYKAEVERHELEKEDIKKDAEALDAKADEWNRKSDSALHQHHQWALATTAEQIAIALAAITLLTRKKWMMFGAYAMATVGIVLGVLAWMHVDPIGALTGAHAVAAR